MKRLMAILLTVCICLSMLAVFAACDTESTGESDVKTDRETINDTEKSEESSFESDPGHVFDTEWSYDDTHHWHICDDCNEIADKAEHTWDEGRITAEATKESDGEMTYTCIFCEKTKTEGIKFEEEIADTSNYSVTFSNTSDDMIYIVEKNEIGLPVAIYYDDAIYGECYRNGRALTGSLEYTEDNLISVINIFDLSGGRYYFEFEYNEDKTCAYGVAYMSGYAKKVEEGSYIVLTCADDGKPKTLTIYSSYGSVVQYVFDDNGRLVRLIDGDGANLYEYDEQGRLTACTYVDVFNNITSLAVTFHYEGNSGLPCSYDYYYDEDVEIKVTDLTYDENGQVLTATILYYEGEEYSSSQCVSTYDEDGRRTRFEMKETYSDEPGVVMLSAMEFKYNADGLLTEAIEFGNARLDTPAEPGVLPASEEKTENDTEFNIDTKIQYEYDEKGNCIREAKYYYEDDGVTIGWSNITEYTYNENNLCISESNEYGKNFYTYDANGFLISEERVYSDGYESDPFTYKWIFDDKGRLIETNGEKITYNEDGRRSTRFIGDTESGSGTTYTYTYDDMGRVMKSDIVVTESRWDNELNTRVLYVTRSGSNVYTYGANGALTSASLYEWDYSVGEYVNNTYDYSAIK